MCKMLPIPLAMLNLAWFLSPPTAFAQCDACYYWQPLFGDWPDPENWVHEEWDDEQEACVELPGVPGCGNCVLIGIAGIDVHGFACANTVQLRGIMDIENGGALSVLSELDVDYMSQVKQWPGSSSNLNTLTVGHYSTAEYYLRGGTLHADLVTLGVFGSGTLWQSGGSAVVGGIAFGTGYTGVGSSRGTYVLEAGDLIAGFLNIATHTDSVGSFVQTGGVNTITGEWALHVGLQPGASGRYELSGTGELNTRWAAVGYWGTGNFIQTGGTHLLTGDGLYVGAEIDSNGLYELSGNGELQATGVTVGNRGSGTFLQNGGLLQTRSLNVGLEAPGVFTQTGGSNTITGFEDGHGGLIVGHDPYVEGSYELGGSGDLWVNAEAIGWRGNGTFIQTGGTHAVMGDTHGHLTLGAYSGSDGRYELSGGGQLRTKGITVGETGTGTFIQTGGAYTVTEEWAFVVGKQPESNGRYELSGTGELNTRWAAVGYWGRGTFIQTGGTHSVTGDGLYVGAEAGSDGTYELSGSGVLNTTWETVGNNGPGRFIQTGGTINAVTVTVGRDSIGTFIHTGGTHTVTGPDNFFMLGAEAGADGSYELSGSAELHATRAIVGYSGTGTFIQTGGTNTLAPGDDPTSLLVGVEAGSDGQYQLSGGTLLVGGAVLVGYAGTAKFIQSGGTNTIARGEDATLLLVGTEAGSDGQYELSGGTLHVAGDVLVGPEGTSSLLISGQSSSLEAQHVLIATGSGSGSLSIADAGATISIADLTFGANATFTAVPGSSIHIVGGSVQNYSTDEAALAGLENLNLICEGGPIYLEVGGYDDGPDSEACTNNFVIDTLTVNGVVVLVDSVDNGNRGGTYGWQEALYVNHLVFGPDGMLYTNALHLYVGCEPPPPDPRICTGSEKGDFDRNCDIDLTDYSEFHACLAGAEVSIPPSCNRADFDDDNDVDLADFGRFQVAFTGQQAIKPWVRPTTTSRQGMVAGDTPNQETRVDRAWPDIGGLFTK